jgi:hypothetical protein
MSDSMLPPVDPIGGTDDPSVPSGHLGQRYGGMGTDAQTDARTISEIEGKMTDELDHSGWQCDVPYGTLADEIRQRGWQDINKPVGGTPAPASTIGGRGAADIGHIPGGPVNEVP